MESKIIVFAIHDIIFSIFMVFLNVGINKGIDVYVPMIVQVMILSAFMTLLGFLCATYFKNIKQFTFAYLFISLCMITPVFLEANTSLTFSFMKYYPVYYLYQGLKHAFWGKPSSVLYYLLSVFVLIIVFLFDEKRLETVLVKEE